VIQYSRALNDIVAYGDMHREAESGQSITRRQLLDNMKAANRLIESYAQKKKNLLFIDVFTPMLNSDNEPRKELFTSDGLHLNAAGYELWASIIRPYLNK
jgi:lysophospholipase L1-like esterase